jgi:hypothetical protein
MVLWFAGTAFLAVWLVFRDPAFDYRLVIVGALPDVVDAAFGGAAVLHSVLGSVLLLAVVMVATIGRRRCAATSSPFPSGPSCTWCSTGPSPRSRSGGRWPADRCRATLPVAGRGWWNWSSR